MACCSLSGGILGRWGERGESTNSGGCCQPPSSSSAGSQRSCDYTSFLSETNWALLFPAALLSDTFHCVSGGNLSALSAALLSHKEGSGEMFPHRSDLGRILRYALDNITNRCPVRIQYLCSIISCHSFSVHT